MRVIYIFCFTMEMKIVLFILLLPLLPCFGCHPHDRTSLLDFKQGFNLTATTEYYKNYYEEYNNSVLESWSGFNCCAWEGVACHPRTAHVISLDLGLMYIGVRIWREFRGGLFQLLHLEHLDLSYNRFNGLPIPLEFHKLTKLRYLNLFDCGFSGKISREIANMSRLKFLDLSYNFGLESSKLGERITHLRGLEHLGLSGVNLTLASGSWGEDIGTLANLKTLELSDCGLSREIPPSIANLSRLEELDLSYNSLRGKIPSLRWPLSLSSLHLYENKLEGSIPSSLSSLSKLSLLDLSSNQLNGSIPSILGNLSSLAMLHLSHNSLSGTIPTSLAKLSKLIDLDLRNNNLSGTIPTSLAKITNLIYLDLTNNKLSGTYSLSLLDMSPKIQSFYLSRNLLTVKVNATYIPKFQLEELGLRFCNIEGDFPAFISAQYSLRYLDLSENSLSGNIPDWLWDSTPLNYLNLSANQFVGHLPSKFLGFKLNNQFSQIIDLHKNKLQGNIPLPHQYVSFLDLSENLFDGPIPTGIGKLGQSLWFLSLAKNNLSGVIPHFMCEPNYLKVLDLSNNRLSGKIPRTLEQCSDLIVLNVENNDLKEMIPNVFGKMIYLETLKLGENGLKGHIPSSLQNCNSLEILDMRNNNMHGSIPNWIERLQSLRILVLKSNKFVGKIPSKLSNMQNIQVLDMSNNKFSGVIPDGFMKLSAMANDSDSTERLEYQVQDDMIYVYELVIHNKGQDMDFQSNLRLVKCLDLSNNNLSGKIPWDIDSLKGLIILNVSINYFMGEIPKSLGNMVQLQSLDLSQNELSGIFPIELQRLTWLSYFNVSHNNLSGMVPQGGQMMTFDSSSFSNNSGLCGLPINVSCSKSHLFSPKNEESKEEWEEDDIWWYVGMCLGYVLGFAPIIWVLYFSKSWSAKCFKAMDGIIMFLFQTFEEKFCSTR